MTIQKPIIVRWTGKSGHSYDFHLDPIGTPFKDRPGVYIACKLARNGNWDAIYIGETESFQQRLSVNLLTHHKWASMIAAGATHFCTLHVPGVLWVREGIETDLRRNIPTPCNDQ
ncbi:hypothetical protein [Chelativorans sp. AA-79]|uniref:hypothetical protein n=1 Tax=Chelativorans sp. AA-79 TaxID=3028735 RepID=UPI0023F6B60B|nr:hypothetical protein [Chelativorans sp. AA-79]WEX10312.1 hypothetical protein PVE73_04960 [Chelativorans sp. AA-79]